MPGADVRVECGTITFTQPDGSARSSGSRRPRSRTSSGTSRLTAEAARRIEEADSGDARIATVADELRRRGTEGGDLAADAFDNALEQVRATASTPTRRGRCDRGLSAKRRRGTFRCRPVGAG